MSEQTTLKVIRLEAVDFKRIEAVAIDTDTTKPIILTGDNAQGKSSILDAIMWALTRKGTDKPVRDGAEEATVALTLRDGSNKTYTIKRRAKDGKDALQIKTEDGQMPKPQTFLDSLIGNLAFDPEAFTRMKPKEQADMLREAVGLDVSDLEERYKTAYAQRTEASRTKDQAEKLYKACPIVAGAPKEEANVADLIAEQDKLRETIIEANGAMDKVEGKKGMLNHAEGEVKDLEDQLARAKDRLEKAKTEYKEALEKADKLIKDKAPATQRLEEVAEQIKGISDHNAAIRDHNRQIEERQQKEQAYKVAIKRHKELDDEVKAILKEKEDRIKSAKFPIDGLSIDEDTVTINNVPFSDLNTAERIKISASIAIAQNPSLRIIFVREGALVNRANLKVLEELAQKHDMQVWIEKFQEEPGESGLHMVAGSVTHIDGKESGPTQLELV